MRSSCWRWGWIRRRCKKEIFKKLALKYLERCAAGREGSDCGGDRSELEIQRRARWRKRTDDIRSMMQAVIEEFVKAEQIKAEPAYKAELVEERKRRESLEQRVNELVAENERIASEGGGSGAERGDPGGAAEAGGGEDRPGVQGGEGRDSARGGRAAAGARTDRSCGIIWRSSWARIRSCCRRGWREGRARAAGQRSVAEAGAVDLDKIRPGMSAEERERVRQEIARVASQTLRGV